MLEDLELSAHEDRILHQWYSDPMAGPKRQPDLFERAWVFELASPNPTKHGFSSPKTLVNLGAFCHYFDGFGG